MHRMLVSMRWGTTPEEERLAFPGDRFREHWDAMYNRGVTIQAPPGNIFRWLCQLRVAPYSYDWIDNLGRRSPRALTPGAEDLAVGQLFLVGFELVDFQYNRHLTLRVRLDTIDSKVVGDMIISYMIVPQGPNRCRLLARFLVRYRRGPIGWIMRVCLPWADLVMMRRQLLNLKKLSESMPTS